MDELNSKAKYWLEIAAYDLETAKAMLDTKRYLYVGFMCHQTIEKGLKAIIAQNNVFPPKIHNLEMLAEKAEIKEKLTENQVEFIISVNPLNIESRYPRYIQGINTMLTQDKCKEIITETEAFFSWIKQYLKS